MYRTVRAQACQACGTGLAVGPAVCVKQLANGALTFIDHAETASVTVPLTWHENLAVALREIGAVRSL